MIAAGIKTYTQWMALWKDMKTLPTPSLLPWNTFLCGKPHFSVACRIVPSYVIRIFVSENANALSNAI